METQPNNHQVPDSQDGPEPLNYGINTAFGAQTRTGRSGEKLSPTILVESSEFAKDDDDD